MITGYSTISKTGPGTQARPGAESDPFNLGIPLTHCGLAVFQINAGPSAQSQ